MREVPGDQLDDPESGHRSRSGRAAGPTVDLGAMEPPSWWERLELYLSPGGRWHLVAGVLVGAVVITVFWHLSRPAAAPVENGIPLPSVPPGTVTVTTAATHVVVHAAGAVESAGVYRLPTGSRVGDLIEAAGGGLPDADLDRLNLAAVLVDGSQVYIPRVGETLPAAPQASSPASGTSTGSAQLVPVNTASVEELEGLPGVGPATAGAIVEYRDEHGPFQSIDELLEVSGIGEAKLAQISELVTLG